jgi:hypothetical protein
VELFLLAGLPNPEHARAERVLKDIAGRYAKVISVASGGHDGYLFRPGTVDTLVRGAAQFAVRRFRHRSADQAARPRRIVLFYVPAGDDHQLLSAFDFFVFSVPMRELAHYDEAGRQLRHQSRACEPAIRQAFDSYSRHLVNVVQSKVESRRSSEPLLLPPLNFRLSDRPLQHVFRELTCGVRTWERPFVDELVAEEFDHERLPEFLRPQERQMAFRDARGVVFPCARPTESHALRDREIHDPLGDDRDSVADLQDILRSAYRFGTPLPDGFHHDAQLEWGRRFHDMEFQCSRRGRTLVNGSHVNIYPNDFVRFGQ